MTPSEPDKPQSSQSARGTVMQEACRAAVALLARHHHQLDDLSPHALLEGVDPVEVAQALAAFMVAYVEGQGPGCMQAWLDRAGQHFAAPPTGD